MSEHDRPIGPPGAPPGSSGGAPTGAAAGPDIPDIEDASLDEADRLIAAALADHVRRPAPRRLHDQLARRHLAARRPWRAWIPAFALGAASAAALVLLVVRAPAGSAVIADEAVGDHLRIVGAQHPLEVETNDLHNVKPWFTPRLDFVPPINFIGDDEFRLRGGELAVFLGHKAAAFIYQRRLHTISLFVFADTDVRSRQESTVRGFHVITWASGGFGMALVSDVGWDDLRLLEARLRN
jgi:anti-sigma factor RsiW